MLVSDFRPGSSEAVGGSKPLFTAANAPGLIFDELAVSKEKPCGSFATIGRKS